MIEKVLTFLDKSPLVGIMTEPDAERLMEGKPERLLAILANINHQKHLMLY